MIKIVKSRSSGKIIKSFEDRSRLSKKRPEKSLTVKIQKTAGRDGRGKISVRHKGGGAKRLYRVISPLDQYIGQKGKVLSIEYDPNRSAFIALIELNNLKKAYIISPDRIKVGSIVACDDKAEIKIGNRMRLKNIPTGTQIHAIQFQPDSKSLFATSAGSSATLMAIEDKYALVKMPSGEIRKIHENCFASIGQVSNIVHSRLKIGSAGRKRKMGIRPTVRGKAMHPGAHPHGGGEGVNPIGLKYPKSPWGKIAIGGKTRRKKYSQKFIIQSRKRKR
ncbi:50S ribosomal protein L2 [Candidatus Berkelbacteria bacterium CG10_big_fil_rev_8_21_14_0_10_41_12]|uniref:50S ribosomal protein L2 n=1 Tax=Candidatus Berkelbacteria bacterium CG10_big_fil_rev_8_21_14_0_10_41_12 TaxID=1974513 RepID=A0A2M6WXR8_9BACT|nr:MAG: 50S ribosomal protein L2 [Candidatus Berkelbacteria bacterium CG10_big_fil_rev_8_21_14_0_10_41_12]